MNRRKNLVSFEMLESRRLMTVINVLNNGDAGADTLRAAIAAATDGDTIDLSARSGTITLTSGVISLNKNLTITGPGAGTLTISGNDADRIFAVPSGKSVSMSGVTLTHGIGTSGGAIAADGALTLTNVNITDSHATNEGAAIYSFGTLVMTDCSITDNTSENVGGGLSTYASVTMTRCTIADNVAHSPIDDDPFMHFSFGGYGRGGGFAHWQGDVTMTNCTIAGNQAIGDDAQASPGIAQGGGIYFVNSGTLSMMNCTIAGNSVTAQQPSAAGIYAGFGSASRTFTNCIIAGNTGSSDLSDFSTDGPGISGGHNLIGVLANGINVFVDGTNGDKVGTAVSPIDAKVDALADNGGATPTAALESDSPAVNAGTSTGAPSLDQRGQARVGAVDIGAFEFAVVNTPPAFNSTGGTTASSGATYTYNITTLDADSDPLTISATTKPSWLTFTDNGDGTATLTGTPTNSNAGNNNVVLRVSDGTDHADQSYTIAVSAVNHAPAFSSTAITTANSGTVYNYAITTTDADANSRTITAPTLPAWLTFHDNGDGTASLSGTPADTDFGSQAVQVQVNDGAATTPQNFNITVAVTPVVLDNDGTLRVNGTTSADDIHVWTRGDQVRVQRNGALRNFSKTLISKVQVLTFDEADTILINTPGIGAYAIGGEGNDSITGGEEDDILTGGGGNDVIIGAGGADRLNGSGGADRMSGGDGADRLFGGDANDTLDGGSGIDVLRGEDGNDALLAADKGPDTLYGGNGTGDQAQLDSLLDAAAEIEITLL